MIEKVSIISRKLIRDERGWFLKVITGKEEGLPPHSGEVYLTMGRPGQMRGGHYHPLASEWFTIIEGSATLKLEDLESKEKMSIKLHFEDAKTVFVPHGVAHGFFNDTDEDFIVLAYSDRLYAPADTITYEL